MEYDSKALSHLDDKLDRPFNYNFGKAAFRSGKVVSEPQLLEAERLNNKNPEAKQMAEGALIRLKAILSEEKGKIKNGLLDGGRTRAEKDKVREEIDESLRKLNNIKVPDNFFQANIYGFTNSLGSCEPRIFGDKQDDMHEAYRAEVNSMAELIDTEDGALHKLSNDLYHSRTYGDSRDELLKIGGFDIPAINLEGEFAPSAGYQINDMARFKDFFASLEGKNMSRAEFQAVLKEAVDSYQKDIDSVPGAREAIRNFSSLRENNQQFIQRNFELLNAKMNGGRKSSGNEAYKIENKIFRLKA